VGFGDGGLGSGPNPQAPIPNPQSPIPNPQKNYFLLIKLLFYFIITINYYQYIDNNNYLINN
jgi:hypothetical protein